MNEYEITYLSDPQLSDEARSALDAAIDAMVDQVSGTISFSEPPARRRLFYPIKKQLVGFARTMNVTLPSDHVAGLREQVKKQAGVLRVTLLKTPRREEVSPSVLDAIYQRASAPAKAAPAAKKPAKPVTMAEVEEKIEEALDEEVK